MDTLFHSPHRTGGPQPKAPKCWRWASPPRRTRPRGALRSRRRPRTSPLTVRPPVKREQVVCCKPQNGVVALVAVDRAMLEQLEGRYPGRLNYSTRFARAPKTRKKQSGSPAAKPALCQSLPRRSAATRRGGSAPGPEEVTYFIERLGQLFPLADFELRLSGDEDKKHPKNLQGKDSKRSMRIISGKYKGRAINPPAQSPGPAYNGLRQGEHSSTYLTIWSISRSAMSWTSCRNRIHQLRIRLARRPDVTSVEINPVHYDFIPPNRPAVGDRKPPSRQGQCVPLSERVATSSSM